MSRNKKVDYVTGRYESLLLTTDDFQFFLKVLDSVKTKPPSMRSLAAVRGYRRGNRKGVRFYFAN
jgi:hypothetical protein